MQSQGLEILLWLQTGVILLVGGVRDLHTSKVNVHTVPCSRDSKIILLVQYFNDFKSSLTVFCIMLNKTPGV